METDYMQQAAIQFKQSVEFLEAEKLSAYFFRLFFVIG
jgi:hypothetical protein